MTAKENEVTLTAELHQSQHDIIAGDLRQYELQQRILEMENQELKQARLEQESLNERLEHQLAAIDSFQVVFDHQLKNLVSGSLFERRFAQRLFAVSLNWDNCRALQIQRFAINF